MKAFILVVFALLTCPAWAGMSEFRTLQSNHVCEYKTVTTVVNKGDENCVHEWVLEPTRLANAVNAVYCPCGCPDAGLNKICRKCLRKINEQTVSTSTPRPESEYELLNRLLGGEK